MVKKLISLILGFILSVLTFATGVFWFFTGEITLYQFLILMIINIIMVEVITISNKPDK